MNEEILTTKTKEIQQQLEDWAHRERLLEPGEQLVFTLKVAKVPIVVCDASSVLKMEAEDFFSFTRLRAEMIRFNDRRTWIITRARMQVAVAISQLKKQSGRDTCPMSDFLTAYPHKWKLRTIPRIGSRTADLLYSVINAAGVSFPDNGPG